MKGSTTTLHGAGVPAAAGPSARHKAKGKRAAGGGAAEAGGAARKRDFTFDHSFWSAVPEDAVRCGAVRCGARG